MPKAAVISNHSSHGSSVRVSLLICVGFLFIHLLLVLCPPIWGSSEAREAQVVWSILDSGDWILPTRNGIVPSKPPLFHWIAAVIAALTGGAQVWTTRIVSVLSGAAMMFFTLRFAARFWGQTGKSYNAFVEPVTALILGTSYLFFANVIDGKVDTLFSAIVTISVFKVIESLWDRPATNNAQWFFWVGVALSALSKGPLGPALIFVISFVSVVWIFGLGTFLRLIAPSIPMLVGLIGALSWYIGAARVGGDAFVARQLIFENLTRFKGGEAINNEPFWFYLPSFFRTLAPWSFLSLVFVLKRLRTRGVSGSFYLGFLITLIVIICFSLASGKRHSYLLPVAPWFCVSLSLLMIEEYGKINLGSGINQMLLELVALVKRYYSSFLFCWLLGFGFLISEAAQISRTLNLSVPAQMGGAAIDATKLLPLLIISTLLLALAIFRGQSVSRVSALLAVFASVSIPLSLGLTVKGYFKDFEAIAGKISKLTSESNIMVVKDSRDEYFDPIIYYLKRRVEIRSEFKSCSGFILTRKSTLTDPTKAYPFEFREKGAILKGDNSKTLVLMPCT